MRKTIILLALIPILAFGFRGIHDWDRFKCVKSCILDRVWGCSWVEKGYDIIIISAPWTAAGTYTSSIYNEFGEQEYSWFYEYVGPGTRDTVKYTNLSSFLKNQEYWTFLGNGKEYWKWHK